VIAVAGTVAACSSGPQRGQVSGAAAEFVAALTSGDGSSACDMLTSDARQSVTGATEVPCARAVLTVDERGDAVTSVQVWGDAAQVHVGADVVFLRRISGRWLVSAAGCTPRPHRPYDCTVGN
jgi:hypothetical protein